MPKVDQYGESKINSQALQGVMQRAPSNRGAMQLAQGVATLGSDMADKQNFENDQNNKAKVKQADIDIQKAFQEQLYGEDGYLNKKGINAGGDNRTDFFASIEEIGQDIIGELENEEQKAMFSTVMQQRALRANNMGMRHSETERLSYLKATSDARIEAAVHSATLDPSAENMFTNRGVMHTEILEQAAAAGMGDPTDPKSATYLAMEEADSQLHLAVAKALIEQDKPEQAEQVIKDAVHFAQQRDEEGKPVGKKKSIFTGGDKAVYDEMFKVSTFKVKTNEIVEEVFDLTKTDPDDLEEMVASARKKAGKNIEMADESERRIRNRYKNNLTMIDETKKDMFEELETQIVNGEFSSKDLTPEQINTLGGDYVKALRAAEDVDHRWRIEGKSRRHVIAFDKIQSAEEKRNFDIESISDELLPEHFNQIRSEMKQLSSSTQKPLSPTQLQVKTKKDKYNTALEDIGIKTGDDASEEDDERAKLFHDKMEAHIASVALSKGRPLIPQEITEIVDALTLETITEKGWWFTDIGEESTFEFEEKYDVGIDAVKAEKIKALLLREGKIPTVSAINARFKKIGGK